MKKKELPGFRLYKHEPLHETFRRVVNNQLQQSLLLSGQFRENPDYVTHEIRKSTKRIRAVYRLFRKAAGNELYLHGREIYRDLSYFLAPHRLSVVYCDMLKMIAEDKKMPIKPAQIERLIKDMEHRHREITASLIKKHHAENYLSGLLSAELKSNADRPLPSCNIHDLTPGLKRTFGLGKKCVDQAINQPTAENLHELRKIVKSLWNMLILIRPVWPSYYGFQVHQLDTLAQKLGLEHDLAELEKILLGENLLKDKPHGLLLLDYISGKRQQIQKSVLPLAQRLYADKPGDVARKMEIFYLLFTEPALEV
jgi:CHAD domain-containing protein